MAETKPTATVKATSAPAKKSGNSISWIAPVVCVLAGYSIWRFLMGGDSGFTEPDPAGGFWPHQVGPKDAFHRIYEGGIIVPLLLGMFLMVVVFSIERFLTVKRALGNGSIEEFIRTRGITRCPTACVLPTQGLVGAADRAALDFAIEHAMPHGGWCPRGRRAGHPVNPQPRLGLAVCVEVLLNRLPQRLASCRRACCRDRPVRNPL